ncbi:hypothetical protein RMCBS344292_01707 [Rhizopus microsporus]|nr:hypothetical protein RMCBS344292_01707 [Rhizopus microsporus]
MSTPRKRRSSDTSMDIHPNNKTLPNSQSMSCLHAVNKIPKQSLLIQRIPSPRKVSEGDIILKRPPIPPRTSSMPLRLSSKVTTQTKIVNDEHSWTALLKIHKKENEANKRIRSIEKYKKTQDEKRTIKVVENNNVVLIHEWIQDRYQIVAGKAETLFDKLLDEDDDYLDAYLMNHVNFIPSAQLLDQLIGVFYTQKLYQTRILYIIRRWLAVRYCSFEQSHSLFERLSSFLTKEYDAYSNQIQLIQIIIYSQHREFRLPLQLGYASLACDDIPILSMDSKSIARYLCLIDYETMKYIVMHELVDYGNTTNQRCIHNMTTRFNMLNHWIAFELHNSKTLKAKRALIIKFIEISKFCLALNNFHACMIIMMGLSSTSNKLKQAWQSLSNREMNTFTTLQKLLDVSSNMLYYRRKIESAKKLPVIPFLPVILKDITFLKENSTFLVTQSDLINFSKCRSIKEFIEKQRAFISKQYRFQQDDSTGHWLEYRLKLANV